MLIDETGYITNERIRKAYDRICDAPGFRSYHERCDSAEAFLRLCKRYHEEGKLHLITTMEG